MMETKILYVLSKILIATLGQLYYEKCNTEF